VPAGTLAAEAAALAAGGQWGGALTRLRIEFLAPPAAKKALADGTAAEAEAEAGALPYGLLEAQVLGRWAVERMPAYTDAARQAKGNGVVSKRLQAARQSVRERRQRRLAAAVGMDQMTSQMTSRVAGVAVTRPQLCAVVSRLAEALGETAGLVASQAHGGAPGGAEARARAHVHAVEAAAAAAAAAEAAAAEKEKETETESEGLRDARAKRDSKRAAADKAREAADAGDAGGDMGAEGEFLSPALRDQCFETEQSDHGKYTYKVCLFKSVTQIPKKGAADGSKTTTLGTWGAGGGKGKGKGKGKGNDKGKAVGKSGWAKGAGGEGEGGGGHKDYSTMRFSGGDKCYNGPERSVAVSLHCAAVVAELRHATETETCTYVTACPRPIPTRPAAVRGGDVRVRDSSSSSSSSVPSAACYSNYYYYYYYNYNNPTTSRLVPLLQLKGTTSTTTATSPLHQVSDCIQLIQSRLPFACSPSLCVCRAPGVPAAGTPRSCTPRPHARRPSSRPTAAETRAWQARPPRTSWTPC
jgi:hypothetical protein